MLKNLTAFDSTLKGYAMPIKDCPICCAKNEDILYQDEQMRVIAVHDDPIAPAFCRVIWHEHVAEMTDLPVESRQKLMDMVYRVEAAMRHVLQPTKVNLASLGNVVPHLHWHVIARFQHDANFPAPIWATAERIQPINLPQNWTQNIAAYLAKPTI